MFWILYVFFWVFPRRPIVVCRRFGTLYQFHLQGLDVEYEVWIVRGRRSIYTRAEVCLSWQDQWGRGHQVVGGSAPSHPLWTAHYLMPPPPLVLPARANFGPGINTTSSSHYSYFILYIQPLKMELREGSETSANHNRMPGKYPKEYIQYYRYSQFPGIFKK